VTNGEKRLVNELMRVTRHRPKDQSPYRILERLTKSDRRFGGPLSDYHKRWLLELAWAERHHLPAELRVIAALKGAGMEPSRIK
jgi:hypothetical protein